ncbi:PAS domain-containing sensor histidine kinase [Nitrospira moscoviensis]|uniref:Oxygen sensor histidine kinase NreB n=1 Tax=Nitrospira moscoviensis TaxID=42253 RepID=A0A0K2GHF8_NITMO|nr:PAS domain-containing sensor histidine kinase [Nitrospira moscoviensis]ALA60289.1 putative Histidine kinase [Nitrospira moscoviensis]
MANLASRAQEPDDLRRRAETQLSRLVQQSVPSLAPENVEALVHELRVHQIELEMQCHELRKAQAEAEESRNRYRELYESIPIGYVTIDSTGRMIDINPAGLALLGEQPVRRTPTSFNAYFSERDVHRFILFCREVVAKQEPNSGEFEMKRARGGGFFASLQAAPARNDQGQGGCLRVTFKDITRRKEAEEVLRRHQLELEGNRAELRDLAGKLFSAQEEERRRIACELHDDHCQRLTAAILEANTLAKVLRTAQPALVPRLESVRKKLVDLLEDFRHLAHDLHPRNLDTVSLASSMRSHLKEMADYAGLRIEFEEEDVPGRLPMPIIVCLYRLLQESLSNIHKHARATHVRVRLAGSPDRLTLTVADDGAGFDPGRPSESRKGIGLTSMHERVRPLGGTVSIESRPGEGTTITVTIPSPREA